MKFVPRNGNIVVCKTGRASVSQGGIIIPETAQKESETAVVAATCNGWIDDHGRERTSEFQPLDIVLISKYAGESFTMLVQGREQTFTVIKESAVLCRLDDFVPAGNGPLPEVARVAPPRGVMLGGEGAGAAAMFEIDRVPPPPSVADGEVAASSPDDQSGPQGGERPRTVQEAEQAKAALLASLR